MPTDTHRSIDKVFTECRSRINRRLVDEAYCNCTHDHLLHLPGWSGCYWVSLQVFIHGILPYRITIFTSSQCLSIMTPRGSVPMADTNTGFKPRRARHSVDKGKHTAWMHYAVYDSGCGEGGGGGCNIPSYFMLQKQKGLAVWTTHCSFITLQSPMHDATLFPPTERKTLHESYVDSTCHISSYSTKTHSHLARVGCFRLHTWNTLWLKRGFNQCKHL